jgi:hypothetical protein
VLGKLWIKKSASLLSPTSQASGFSGSMSRHTLRNWSAHRTTKQVCHAVIIGSGHLLAKLVFVKSAVLVANSTAYIAQTLVEMFAPLEL